MYKITSLLLNCVIIILLCIYITSCKDDEGNLGIPDPFSDQNGAFKDGVTPNIPSIDSPYGSLPEASDWAFIEASENFMKINFLSEGASFATIAGWNPPTAVSVMRNEVALENKVKLAIFRRWEKVSQSVILDPGSTYEISQTITQGMSKSETDSFTTTLGLSVTGGWGPVSATVSAEFEIGKESTQEFHEETSTTETITIESDFEHVTVFTSWMLVDSLQFIDPTLLDTNGNPIPINVFILGSVINSDMLELARQQYVGETIIDISYALWNVYSSQKTWTFLIPLGDYSSYINPFPFVTRIPRGVVYHQMLKF